MNRTIQRTVDVLDFISTASPKGVSLKEIIDYTRMPKSSAHDIVQSLLSLKLVEFSRFNDKKYVLGLGVFTLGMKYSQKNQNLISLCVKYLNPLADKFHRTGFAGVLDGTNIIYIHKYMGNEAKLATCNIGTKHPAYTTSLGKALVAYLSDEKQREVIENTEFVKKTGNTITSKEEFVENISQVRKLGYSIDDKENEVLMICYGAPVFDSTNEVIAAISLSDMKSNDFTDEEIGNQIKEAALQISTELGYTGNYGK